MKRIDLVRIALLYVPIQVELPAICYSSCLSFARKIHSRVVRCGFLSVTSMNVAVRLVIELD